MIVRDVLHMREQQPRLGTIKLHVSLRDKWAAEGIKVGRDQLYAIMAANQMLIKRRNRKKPRTTFSNHHFKTYPDLAKSFTPMAPSQLFVADITYLPLDTGKFCFLFLITDAYSKLIVGYKLANSMHICHALDALSMAQQRRTPGQNTIHHSDRGIQYCAPKYTNQLKHLGFTISMTQASDPRDNAVAERVNGILKEELIYPFGSLNSYQEAINQVDKAIATYNLQRPHLSCNLKTPILIHEQKHKPVNLWKKQNVNQS